MPAFETANIMLALAGNRKETVPKYGVTASEIAVLRLLHGEDAVYDIDPVGVTEEITDRQEIERLRATYQRRDGEKVISDAVAKLFPGAYAKAIVKLKDLELPEELFAVKARKSVDEDDDNGDDEKPLDKMTANELRTYAAKYQDLDIGNLTKKADLLEAIQLHEKKLADTSENVFE